MLAHYKAVQAALKATGLGEAYLVNVPAAPTLPYWVIEPVNGSPGPDLPVCGVTDDLDLTFRMKTVAGTPEGAMTVAAAGRDAVAGGFGRSKRLPVVGRSVEVKHLRHEADYTETAVVTPTTNRVLALSIDTCRLVSTPA